MRVRKNVNALTDDTLLWYSRAVQKMKEWDITNPSSWWYQAAIHGFSVGDGAERSVWQQAKGFPPPPSLVNSVYWQQCQHGTWFFLPWHRMYLYFFEQIVAKTIVDLGGPADWSLPYWNYCDYYNPALPQDQQQRALTIPAAFGTAAGPNPDYPGLWIAERENYTLLAQNVDPTPAMEERLFTNEGLRLNFGGGVTGFSHFGSKTGQLEQLPHNQVHVDIGDVMGDPDTAALDPIFWLHHANIDRIWQNWLDQPGRENPSDSRWLNFSFEFHDAQGVSQTLKVADVTTVQQLGYVYSPDYPMPTSIPAPPRRPADRLLDVLGASIKPLNILAGTATADLDFVPKAQRMATFAAKLAAHAAKPEPKQTFIQLHNVTGAGVAPPIDVFVKDKKSGERHLVGSVGLFGLKQASTKDARSDGNGLSLTLDATEALETLSRKPGWSEENVAIELEPQRPPKPGVSIQVGRISLHSEITN